MAKRRRLVAPDQSELERLDEGFAAKPPLGSGMAPPIAQVAGEAAALGGMAGVSDRVAAARDSADAEKWRSAEQEGRAIESIPLADIQADYLRRDRIEDTVEAREELLNSIRQNGLRAPIEVVALAEGYGLIAGHRRLDAFKTLAGQDPQFARIPAFLRRPADSADAYVNMVEENEVRANLSHYERGRIAVVSAQSGVFETVEEAINRLFEHGSKSKRSKIRSFAAVHEALGDLLQFPKELTERTGLKVAAALRGGAQPRLRAALADQSALTAQQEMQALERAIEDQGPLEKEPSRGGRPNEYHRLPAVPLEGGGSLSVQFGINGMRLEVKGREVPQDLADETLAQVKALLG
ncbi:ParB/RepB/Spo0J family partition protein [Cognatishimia maritima]|uniref:Chromosome partitioning protein, ParB family n=1 Tax=Cognatishimia maritima TaxID=870908 RepID=A0A1M5VUM2_9RHOB|nr:ParB N-terminal domain-containing protein [Cognatishimia maritima]SHH78989.1 chromosome partitioning protein, ParB family [Cognatishimia maritima]